MELGDRGFKEFCMLGVADGYIAVPTAPGLGIELREDVLACYAYREHAPRTIPRPGDEGP